MVYQITHSGRLPSLNEMVEANRTNPHKGAKIKKSEQNNLCMTITVARLQRRIVPVTTEHSVVVLEWHEATRRRDADNVESGAKMVLDSLVQTGILINDTRRYVEQVYHHVVDDKANGDGIVIRIYTEEDAVNLIERVRTVLGGDHGQEL